MVILRIRILINLLQSTRKTSIYSFFMESKPNISDLGNRSIKQVLLFFCFAVLSVFSNAALGRQDLEIAKILRLATSPTS